MTTNVDKVLSKLSEELRSSCSSSDFGKIEVISDVAESLFFKYADKYRKQDRSLPKLDEEQFLNDILFRLKELPCKEKRPEDVVSRIMRARKTCPTSGAIIVNKAMTKVLMVKGYESGAKWGYPKGKLKYRESTSTGAIREVNEETGLDISEFLTRKSERLEINMHGKTNYLYIVKVSSEDRDLTPLCRGEVSAIQWIPIKTIPGAEGSSMNQTDMIDSKHESENRMGSRSSSWRNNSEMGQYAEKKLSGRHWHQSEERMGSRSSSWRNNSNVTHYSQKKMSGRHWSQGLSRKKSSSSSSGMAKQVPVTALVKDSLPKLEAWIGGSRRH